ncbi:hypothetical protein Plo01_40710 [Planobispora longispora]|uniref:Uncharacterized protein n=1 Tax=Planobispora longispora TaxID=28887 RepID=A0A8J3W6A6_9ACTN|nr:hypothetical protein GCM10020093_104500 [Planobispora longispora]GIH77642.1 hypothetical protein Plo01_40710 [Planobispora longispora]
MPFGALGLVLLYGEAQLQQEPAASGAALGLLGGSQPEDREEEDGDGEGEIGHPPSLTPRTGECQAHSVPDAPGEPDPRGRVSGDGTAGAGERRRNGGGG